jgi:hypothetical protein
VRVKNSLVVVKIHFIKRVKWSAASVCGGAKLWREPGRNQNAHTKSLSQTANHISGECSQFEYTIHITILQHTYAAPLCIVRAGTHNSALLNC